MSLARTLHALSLVCAAALALPHAAFAAPQVDQNQGIWTDLYPDNAGIASGIPETFGIRHDPFARLVTLADDAPRSCRQATCAPDEAPGRYGQVATLPIAPVSFDGWNRAYVRFTASQAADVELRFLGSDGQTYGPFALLESDDPAWTNMVDLSGVPASVSSGRLLFHMRERVVVQGVPDDDPNRPADDPADVRIRPTLTGLRATWTPRSVVRVAVEAPASACTNASYTVRVRASVSLVKAQGLVVWAPLDTPAPDTFGLTYPLQFRGASDGGQYTSSGLTIGETVVPPNSVYWSLGDVDSGNTFVVSFNVAAPVGTLNETAYTATASANAANAAPAVAPEVALTTVQSAPQPRVRKTPNTAFLINNRYYINAGNTLSYNLFIANWEVRPSGNVCTETYHRVVLHDDVSDLVNPSEGNFGSVFVGSGASAFTISHGGQFTATELTVHGVTVPANSIYWDLDTMTVGDIRNLSYSVQLKDGASLPQDHVIHNSAFLVSGHQTQRSESHVEVVIGIPNTPSGLYAKGDRIRGSSQIGAGRNDNANLSIGYGDPVTFLLYAQNRGASQLANTVFVDKVPDHTTFSSAFLPASHGGTVYYHTGGEANATNDPPDYDVATGAFGPSWTTTLPANPSAVRWVGFTVPRLASPFFPTRVDPNDDNSPFIATSVTAEMTVTVNQPEDGCPLLTVNNRGLFRTYGFIGVGESSVTPVTGITSMIQDDEPVQVVPLVPSFHFLSVGATPASLINTGNVTFNVNVVNRQPGGAETDTALDVVATLTMPRMSLNGVLSHVPFVSASAPGGTVDLSGLPETIVVRYPSIAPNVTRNVAITVNVPSGFVSGQSIGLTATVVGQDDVCGPVQNSQGRNVTVTGNPYLAVSKRATLGVAARGSEIEYILSYTNLGDAVSTKTWIVDRIPAGADFAWARPVANGGQVWFSDRDAPLLPGTMRDETPVWTDALVRQNFFQGTVSGDQVLPPGNIGTPIWVAFLVDNNNLNPPQFPSSGLSTLSFAVTVRNDAEVGDVIRNEGGVFSNELLTAISNETATIVSDDPSLDVFRTCPDVVGSGETFTYRFDWVNNSTNDDYNVRFIESLPEYVTFVSATHTWNDAAAADHGDTTVSPVWDASDRTITWNVSAAIDPTGQTPIRSFEGGSFEVTVVVDAGTASGTFADIGGVALATDFTEALALSLATGCRILVENADLFVRLNINEPNPVAGEAVTYTVTVSNEGANVADNTEIVVTLPPGVTWTPGGGSVIITTPGWTAGGPPAVTVVDGQQTLTWSVATGNALTRSGHPAGRFPGRSGDVGIALQVAVGATVPPETTLVATATVATTSGEDSNYPNEAEVTALTPLADPWVLKTGPSFAQPGASITYRLRYGNESRQAAGGVFLVDRLYDAAPVNGEADVTLIGITANNGETVYYNAAPLTGDAPAFNPANPAATGWRTAIDGQPVHFIGFYRPSLAGSAGPFSIFIDVALRSPSTGREPQAGATIPNVASIDFTDPDARDQNPENNLSTVETRTPGVDIAAGLVCTPEGAFPAAVPGQVAGAALELRNNGTVTAYGLKVLWTPQPWFSLDSDDAGTVTVVSASGAEGTLVDDSGNPLSGPISWSRQEGAFILGAADAGSPSWYRRVGLPAGATVRILVEGTIDSDLVSGTQVTHNLEVVTDYRFDFDPDGGEVEEILDNNFATCATTVFRPDPMVIKRAAGVGKSEPFTVGDRIEYSIEYNNIGAAAADEVFIEDYLPEDTGYVIGSIANLPEGTTVRFDDGSGAFTYTPVGAVGAVDDNVKAFRINWGAPLPAPAGATFRQDSRVDFEAGTFSGTMVSTDGESLIVTGRAGGNRGTYTTPPIPTDEAATVVEWGRIVVNARIEEEGASVTVSVLDADSGAVIASGLVPDASGAVELDIDPLEHGRIMLRADMVGAGVECSVDNPSLLPIELEFQTPPYSWVESCVGGDTIVGTYEDYTEGYRSNGVTWQRSPDGEITSSVLPSAGFYDYPYIGTEDGLIVGETYDRTWNYGTLAVWEREGDGWRSVPMPEIDWPEDFRWSWAENAGRSTGVYSLRASFQSIGSRTMGAYYRDETGQWQFRFLPNFLERQCDRGFGAGDVLYMHCRNDQNHQVPAAFYPKVEGAGSFEWLPYPDNVQPQNGISARMALSGDAAVFEGYDGSRWVNFVIERRDTHWEAMPLTHDAGIRSPRVRMAISETELLVEAEVDFDGSWRWTGALAARGGEGWELTPIPGPEGYTPGTAWNNSYPVSKGQNGQVVLQCQIQVSGVWRTRLCVSSPQQDGSWRTLVVSPDGNYQNFYPNGLTASGAHSVQGYDTDLTMWRYGLMRDVLGADDALEQRFLWDDTPTRQGSFSTVRDDLPPSIRAIASSCSFDIYELNRSKLSVVPEDDGEGTFTARPVAIPEEMTIQNEGRFQGGGFGAFVGENYTETNTVPVAFIPDPGLGLRAYSLPFLEGQETRRHYAQWISPDHRIVLGFADLVTPEGSYRAPVMWRFVEGEDRFSIEVLPTSHPERDEGQVSSNHDNGYERLSGIGTTGWARTESGSTPNGFWALTPGKDQPVTWLTPHLPDVANTNSSISPLHGGDDYVLVQYMASSASGGSETRLVVVEQDASTESGLSFTPLPFPDGATPGQISVDGASMRSDLIYGRVQLSGTWTPFIWSRSGDSWIPRRVSPEGASSTWNASRRRFGPEQLPIVSGNFPGSSAQVLVPTAAGDISYEAPVFPPLQGYDSFSPWSNTSGVVPWPRYSAFIHEGFIVGRFNSPSGSRAGYHYLNDDLTWTSGLLPGIEDDDAESLYLDFAAPGPVLYGQSNISGRNSRMVAWYFPGGDMSAPVVVDLHASIPEIEWTPGQPQQRSCWHNTRGFSKPGADGYSLSALDCDGFNGRTFAVVAPSATGIRVTHTSEDSGWGSARVNPDSDLVPVWSGNEPKLIGCSRGGGVAIDATQVLFRTDVNPAFQYRVQIPNVCQTSVTNTATIFTSSPQVTASNDRSTVTSAIETVDVAVDLSADRGTVEVGESILFTATVTNNGPGPARDVRLSVFLPDGAGGDNGRLVQRNLGTLQPGEVRTVNESVHVTTDEPFLPLNAAANVTTGSIECDDANNADTVSVLTGSLPNVTVLLTGPTSWPVGQEATFVATALNNGNSTASGVTLVVTLPAVGTIESITVGDTGVDPFDCTVVGRTVSCDIGTLVPIDREGSPAVVTVTMSSAACEAIDSRNNVDAVVGASLDANVNDNTARVTTTVLPPPGRLNVQASPSRATIETGEDLTWFLHYRNTGTEAVSDATLRFNLPAGVSLRQDGTTPGYVVDGDSLSWTLPPIGPNRGGIATVAVVVTGTSPSTLSGQVGIDLPEGANACPVMGTSGPAVVSPPGVHVTKRASASVGCGDPVEWLLTVTNTSDTAYDNLVVTDRVPAQSPYITGSIRGPGASAQGNPVLSWTIPHLAPGQAVTLGFSSQAPNASGALVSNVANVERGGQTIASSAPAIVWATCSGASLRLSKRWNAGCAVDGQAVEVTVTATNTTQQALLTPRIADPLPQGFVFEASSTGATYDASTGEIVQSAASILGGQTLTMRYTAIVHGAAGSVLFEAATGTAGGVQPQTSNPVSVVVQNCDDGDPCTVDTCQLFVGCVNTLTPIPGVSDDECDGVDNNCNGLTDEDWVNVDTTCGVGVCARGGALVCPPGATSPLDTCEAGEPESERDESCDGLDNNCSGQTDEHYASYDFVCGDFCAGLAPTSCVDGEEVWNCAAAPATMTNEACDDGDACSDISTCDGMGTCRPRRYINCNDDNACTQDSCDPATGCVFEALSGTPCSDFNLCTAGDVCVEGECVGDLIPCPEGDACQGEGTCNPATGVCDYPILPGDIPVPVRMRDLGTLGGEASAATAINSAGVVVGHAETASGAVHAFVWTAADGMMNITPLAAEATATAINDAGLVTGVMTLGDDDEGVAHAFSWHADHDLTILASGADVSVLGPNAAGMVAGHAGGEAWSSADGLSAAVTIAAPAGGSDVELLALGEGGHLVGRFTDGDGQTRALWWSEATGAVDVTTLVEGEAVAVNASGEAAGAATDADGRRTAHVFRADGNHVALGTLGGEESWAVAINDAGVVIGQSHTADGTVHGFVWTAATGMRDLGSLGGTTSALFISQAGLIAGQSDSVFGTTPAVVWTPDDAMVALDLLTAQRARPVALTEGGVIAGILETPLGARTFIWELHRGTQDIGTLGGPSAVPAAANALGQVVGEASTGVGTMRAFMSTAPVTACVFCDEDNEPPVIHCPQVQRTFECAEGGLSVELGAPSVRDACGLPVEVDHDAPESYGPGVTAVTYTATDSEGNTASCTTAVVVEDTTPPVLDCPDSLTLTAEEGVCGATAVLPVSATDGCDGDTVAVYGPNGDIANAVSFAPGDTTVSVTAIDRAGNTSACSFVVSVVDVSTLVIECPETLTVDAPADFCGYPEALTAEVTDGCGAEMTLQSASESFPLGVTEVEFSARNRIGEEATCATTLTVRDVTAPTIDCGTDRGLQELPAVFSPTTADACGATATLSNPRCVVTDAAGNATVVEEGCDIEVQAGNVLVVHAVPVYIDGQAVPVEAISVAWDISASDASGNVTDATCDSALDLSNRDRDGDGVIDTEDNCPDVYNPDQLDSSLNGVGDACDPNPFDGLVALGSGCGGGELPVGAGLALLALLLMLARARRGARIG